MSHIVAELTYSPDHVWFRPGQDRTARVGLTDYAQESLGDLISVTTPAVGDAITSGEPCGEVESTKSVSDIVAPVSGVVAAVNPALDAAPEIVNDDPYGDGWLFDVTMEKQGDRLLDADGYRALVG